MIRPAEDGDRLPLALLFARSPRSVDRIANGAGAVHLRGASGERSDLIEMSLVL